MNPRLRKPKLIGQTELSIREMRVCNGVKIGSRCLRSVTIFLRVLASIELLKNGGRFTTLSKVPVPSYYKSLTTNP